MLVACACCAAAPFLGEEWSTLQAMTVLLPFPIAALAAVVGRRLGSMAVLGAAASILVLIGAATLVGNGELRTRRWLNARGC